VKEAMERNRKPFYRKAESREITEPVIRKSREKSREKQKARGRPRKPSEE
jgi:hypothetical protein